jgi:Fe-S cluster biogenesis protein NfuA
MRKKEGISIMTQVQKNITDVLEKDIRPALVSHGGDIEFVGYNETEKKVMVRLTGACGGCPFARETLRFQVENVLKDRLPDIVASVESVQ